jgi:hypothetical protein
MRWASQAGPAAVTSNARRLGERDMILTINHASGLYAGFCLNPKWDRNAYQVRKGTVPMFRHTPAHHAICVTLRR